MIRRLELLSQPQPPRRGEELESKSITSIQQVNQSCLWNVSSIITPKDQVWRAVRWEDTSGTQLLQGTPTLRTLRTLTDLALCISSFGCSSIFLTTSLGSMVNISKSFWFWITPKPKQGSLELTICSWLIRSSGDTLGFYSEVLGRNLHMWSTRSILLESQERLKGKKSITRKNWVFPTWEKEEWTEFSLFSLTSRCLH